jgi:hypothetical protein
MIVTFTHKRIKGKIGPAISETITPGNHKVDHRPLAALIYDYMIKEGYIGNQKEVSR